MSNLNNNVSIIGSLAGAPRFSKPHKDGSLTAFITVAARDNFKSTVKTDNGGTIKATGTNFVQLQGYVKPDATGSKGIYDKLSTGMVIGVQAHVRSYVVANGATDATGKPVNNYTQCLQVDSIQFMESLSAKADREARKASGTGAPAIAAGSEYAEVLD